MKLIIEQRNIFEWELDTEFISLLDSGMSEQDLVDKYFDEQNLSASEISDLYYEYIDKKD